MSEAVQPLMYVATLNEGGITKIVAHGFVPRRQVPTALRFLEDDLNSARAFFRRYCRNFYGVKLTNTEFSVYQPMMGGAPPRMGFLESENAAQEREMRARSE